MKKYSKRELSKVLRRHQADTHLVAIASDSILRDLDNPGEYERWRPGDNN